MKPVGMFCLEQHFLVFCPWQTFQLQKLVSADVTLKTNEGTANESPFNMQKMLGH